MTRATRLIGRLTATVAAMVILLTGCAGLPTGGDVRPGLPADEEVGPPDFSFISERPRPGASAEDIVAGFIRAAAVPADAWAGARQYLTPSFAAEWRPETGVTVDALADRAYASPVEGTVEVRTVSHASVDETGAYAGSSSGATALEFTVERQADGEWRIADGPDGILLDADLFARVYHGYELAYFDPSWQYIVPDYRWFPTTNAPTRIVTALIDGGPAPWLADSVRTAFPADVTVAPSVPVIDGIAQVELDAAALGIDSGVADRMATQIATSLESAGVAASVMTVSGTTLVATPAAVRSTAVDLRPLVWDAQGFGFLSGADLQQLPGLSDAIIASDATAVQVSASYDAAAVRRADGVVLRARSDGSLTAVDQAAGSVVPSIDPFGHIWMASSIAPGRVEVALDDGGRLEIDRTWPGATAVEAMQVSRDGTRIAAVVTAGGRTQLWIAGVIRDDVGRPAGLGTVEVLTDLPGRSRSTAWLDDLRIAVVLEDGTSARVVTQVVGGQSTTGASPSGVDTVAGTDASVRVRTDASVLSVRRGANWQEIATGVRLLASVQGMPAG